MVIADFDGCDFSKSLLFVLEIPSFANVSAYSCSAKSSVLNDLTFPISSCSLLLLFSIFIAELLF